MILQSSNHGQMLERGPAAGADERNSDACHDRSHSGWSSQMLEWSVRSFTFANRTLRLDVAPEPAALLRHDEHVVRSVEQHARRLRAAAGHPGGLPSSVHFASSVSDGVQDVRIVVPVGRVQLVWRWRRPTSTGCRSAGSLVQVTPLSGDLQIPPVKSVPA